MGDYFQSLVDLDASPSEAPELAERIRGYLVGRRIIVGARTDNTLDQGGGYGPGAEAGLAFESDYGRFRELETNGVAILQTRTVFHSGQGELSIVCGGCSRTTGLDGSNGEAMTHWQDAITLWWEGKDDATLACPSCSAVERLTEWQHEPAWAFAHFGLTFWNWPTLSETFSDEIQQCLQHRVRLVRGKL